MYINIQILIKSKLLAGLKETQRKVNKIFYFDIKGVFSYADKCKVR